MRFRPLYRAGRLLALIWIFSIASTVFGAEGENIVNPVVAEVKLMSMGDIIMHMPVVNACREADGTYDFRPVFAAIAPELREADVATAVLETVMAGKEAGGYTGYPCFNAPSAIADALKWAGVDLVFTAHNHILDRGAVGALKTLRYLKEIGMPAVGANSSPDPAERIYLMEVHGVKLAFLTYTTMTNGIPTPADKPWLLNRYDPIAAIRDIARAKAKGADFIICALHAGTEYKRQADDSQLSAAHFLIAHGVDVILGSHPHVVEPAEYISQLKPGGSSKTKFIIYSMGNCLSNQRWRYSDYGVTVKLVLEKHLDGTVLTRVEIAPIWVHMFVAGGHTGYRILRVNPGGVAGEDPLLTPADRTHLKQVWADAQETVGTISVESVPITNDDTKDL